MSGDLLMTTVCSDGEEVARLLEEKMRDLQLAATLGKSLLDRNQELESENMELLEQNQQYSEQLCQLTYNISVKDAQLQTYMQDAENEIAAVSRRSNYQDAELMGKKIEKLENENSDLRTKTGQLRSDVEVLEERQQSLQARCQHQLHQLQDRLHSLQNELKVKASLAVAQDTQISAQHQQLVNLQGASNKLVQANNQLQQLLQATEQTQDRLHEEVKRWESRYVECCDMLTEAQHQLRQQQESDLSIQRQYHFSTDSAFIFESSLAQELEDSIRQDLQLSARDIVTVTPKNSSPCDSVLDTARCVRRASERRYTSSCSSNSALADDGDALFSPSFLDSELTLNVSSAMYSTRSQRKWRSCSDDDVVMPQGGWSQCHGSSTKVNKRITCRVPLRVEVVKPMTGSETLSQWQRLATPHLAGVLERRPGVQVRGGNRINDEDENNILNASLQPCCASSNPRTNQAESTASPPGISDHAETSRVAHEVTHVQKLGHLVNKSILHRRGDDGLVDLHIGLNTVMLMKRVNRWYSHNDVLDRWKVIALLTSSNLHVQASHQ